MKISLPDINGKLAEYTLVGNPIAATPIGGNPARVVYSAAHVVADPFSANDPLGRSPVDLEATMEFRRYLASLGLGIAEAMDAAQRGVGLSWPAALELITRTKAELPDALIANGIGTDQIEPAHAQSLDDVRRAYMEQLEAVQSVGGRIILMASRALARVATGPDDYIRIYDDIIAACDQPVILHWLGDMFDPALAGYWGGTTFEDAMETALTIIAQNSGKVDGIKMSLLDRYKEIHMRRRLPAGVKMYTGDDFNYPELIQGDEEGHSHALLGIFDPLAPAAALAVSQLGVGDTAGFRATLDPTVPLARQIFRAPTQYYKTGVVFLAYLNGFQSHFIMLNGAHAARPLPDFVKIFKMADACGLLRDPDLAKHRMQNILSVYGVG